MKKQLLLTLLTVITYTLQAHEYLSQEQVYEAFETIRNDKGKDHQLLNSFLNLAEEKINPNAFINPIDQASILTFAVMMGEIKLAKKLIAKGANVNQQDRLGKTALLSTAFLPLPLFKETIELLLNAGADINHFDGLGITLLHEIAVLLVEAKHSNNTQAIEEYESKKNFLVQKGAISDIKNTRGKTAADFLNKVK